MVVRTRMTNARKGRPSSSGLPEPLLNALKVAKKDAKKTQIQEAVDRWAEFVVGAPTEPAANLLQLNGLQPRIAGQGLAKAWPQLLPSRRRELLDELATMDKTFRARVLATFGHAIFPVDQGEAARALEPVLDSREVRSTLPAMLIEHQSAIAGLGHTPLDPSTFWRVFFSLLDAVSAGSKKPGALFAVVRVGVRALSDPGKNQLPSAKRLESWLKEHFATLAPEFRQEVPTLLGSRSDLLTVLGINPPNVAMQSAPEPGITAPLPEVRPARTSHQDLPAEVAGASPSRAKAIASDEDQLVVLDDWLKDLRHRVACLDALGRQVREAREARSHLMSSLSECELQLTKALAEAHSLADQLTVLRGESQVATQGTAEIRQRMEAADAELSAERAEHVRTQRDHEAAVADWAEERMALLQRVEQTARGRLEQFRQRVADSVKKDLGEPLPPEGTRVDGGLGDVLLVRLHGLLKVLRNEGFDL
jgi:hypothetical protein